MTSNPKEVLIWSLGHDVVTVVFNRSEPDLFPMNHPLRNTHLQSPAVYFTWSILMMYQAPTLSPWGATEGLLSCIPLNNSARQTHWFANEPNYFWIHLNTHPTIPPVGHGEAGAQVQAGMEYWVTVTLTLTGQGFRVRMEIEVLVRDSDLGQDNSQGQLEDWLVGQEGSSPECSAKARDEEKQGWASQLEERAGRVLLRKHWPAPGQAAPSPLVASAWTLVGRWGPGERVHGACLRTFDNSFSIS